MIRILIADDHPIVLRGLKQILSEEKDIAAIGEAHNSQQVLELVKKKDWDMVVLDITMPGRGGVEILKELKKERPRLPVLVLSMHPEEQYGVRALKAGAAGYMTKENAPENLINAIRRILSGGKYISPALADILASDLQKESPDPRHKSLSDREYQVMIMIASGKSLREIAQELSLSVKTISTYRARILEKMGMKNNSQLIYYAIQNRLLE
jgi:two-component system invasion response regulator UvrY